MREIRKRRSTRGVEDSDWEPDGVTHQVRYCEEPLTNRGVARSSPLLMPYVARPMVCACGLVLASPAFSRPEARPARRQARGVVKVRISARGGQEQTAKSAVPSRN